MKVRLLVDNYKKYNDDLEKGAVVDVEQDVHDKSFWVATKIKNKFDNTSRIYLLKEWCEIVESDLYNSPNIDCESFKEQSVNIDFNSINKQLSKSFIKIPDGVKRIIFEF